MSKTWGFFFGGSGHGPESSCEISAYYKFFPGFNVFCRISTGLQMGEDQLDDLELDRPITLRILDGIAWDFAQTKWWRWWKTVRCGGLISSCCPRNPHGKAGNEERRRIIVIIIFIIVIMNQIFIIAIMNDIHNELYSLMLYWINKNAGCEIVAKSIRKLFQGLYSKSYNCFPKVNNWSPKERIAKRNLHKLTSLNTFHKNDILSLQAVLLVLVTSIGISHYPFPSSKL